MDVKKTRLYLLGRPFTIYSDHKPIVCILNKPKTIVPLSIERLILRLQGYDFKIAHISSNENISDYSSRHPFAHPLENNQYLKEYVGFVCKNPCTKALTLTLSWRRPLSYRNQPIDLQSKLMNWFLYDNGVRHERVKYIKQATKNNKTLQKLTYLILENR